MESREIYIGTIVDTDTLEEDQFKVDFNNDGNSFITWAGKGPEVAISVDMSHGFEPGDSYSFRILVYETYEGVVTEYTH